MNVNDEELKKQLKKQMAESLSNLQELSKKGENLLENPGHTDEQKLQDTAELLKQLTEAAKKLVQADEEMKKK
jgi:hypothetical protein